MELEQMDVKTEFLHGYLEETIYMDQPEGFIEPGQEGLVCRLKRSLYGLKKSSWQWYKRFDGFMVTHGLSVDDILVVAKSKKNIGDVKQGV
ncbi:Retrovirus-related Pol polyprotein from transposon TNT 1-94-like protein [Drosera capensis]